MARTSNYIPWILWNVITCLCPCFCHNTLDIGVVSIKKCHLASINLHEYKMISRASYLYDGNSYNWISKRCHWCSLVNWFQRVISVLYLLSRHCGSDTGHDVRHQRYVLLMHRNKKIYSRYFQLKLSFLCVMKLNIISPLQCMGIPRWYSMCGKHFIEMRTFISSFQLSALLGLICIHLWCQPLYLKMPFTERKSYCVVLSLTVKQKHKAYAHNAYNSSSIAAMMCANGAFYIHLKSW